MTSRSHIDTAVLVQSLSPGALPVTWRDPLYDDEARWFMTAVAEGVVEFRDCPDDCPRRRKWDAPGPDHFTTPTGAARHLFSYPTHHTAWLSREYVPHIAAYARAILELGFASAPRSFSRYRKYRRDLVHRRAGHSYETDAEFYNSDGTIALQIEAKKSPRDVAGLVAAIESAHRLSELAPKACKEVEYVLDLSPEQLWVVGPGSIDPALHIFDVRVDGLDATFTPSALRPPR
ncbi:MAG: hypothetical protein AAB131_22785 [Actinomycetota bacterium]